MSLKTFLTHVIVFIIGFISATTLSFLYLKNNIQKKSNDYVEKILINKSLSTENRLQKQKLGSKDTQGIIFSFEGDKLIFNASSTIGSINENNDGYPIEVKVNSKTKFLSIEQKDIGVFQKEMDDYQKLSDNEKASLTPPKYLTEKEVSRDLFTVGKLIIVVPLKQATSTTNSSIIAESIKLLPEVSISK